MADVRQKDADLDMRRIEEFFLGCRPTAALSTSSCAGDDEDDGGAAADTLARRRRRSDLEGDDLAESSAAARRHSRILSRWVARQAEEMITNIERRNRESELLALARLHTVSMLDSSFLHEPRRSPSSPVDRQAERPPVGARAQSTLQMWRELEDMAAATRGERRSGSRAPSNAGDRNHPEGRGSSVAPSESDYNGYDQWSHGNIDSMRRPGEEEEDDDRRSSREQSPDLGEIERERVRQIVRGWMTESGIADTDSRISPRNETQRAEWLGEIERERVRLVREWVQMASQQQRDARASRREERGRERDREAERDGSVTSVTDHEDGQPEHVRRELLRLRGRQARLELIMRMATERRRELQSLSDQHPVSEFAHRNRIQAFLRGRFLRNGRPDEDDQERPPSAAARELGQLRQRHRVSGLREGFRFRLENIVRGQAVSQNDSSASQNISASRAEQSHTSSASDLPNGSHEVQAMSDDRNMQPTETLVPPELETGVSNGNTDMQGSANEAAHWQEAATGLERGDWQPSTEAGFSDWHEETGEEFDGNWQGNTDQDWPHETTGDDDGEDSHMPDAREEWHEDESHHSAETWQDEQADPPMDQQSSPVRRVSGFIPPDDENVYSMELRELLSRRSVSNLLHSGFRESLDQLIQSYVQRQGRAPFDWDLERPLPTPNSPEENQEPQGDDSNLDVQDTVARPSNVFPPPPLPPRQPIWHTGLHHTNWARQNMHRQEMEWDAINDLRADMARIQQQMSNMQRMLEACMDMQLELQRSVRQEVSAALNRSGEKHGGCEESSEDGSKWSQVRKGTCCICCDSLIDSLLYRCGHMCTCSKCANELVRTVGKCPLCRAPIIEVIRAYSIL